MSAIRSSSPSFRFHSCEDRRTLGESQSRSESLAFRAFRQPEPRSAPTTVLVNLLWNRAPRLYNLPLRMPDATSSRESSPFWTSARSELDTATRRRFSRAASSDSARRARSPRQQWPLPPAAPAEPWGAQATDPSARLPVWQR